MSHSHSIRFAGLLAAALISAWGSAAFAQTDDYGSRSDAYESYCPSLSITMQKGARDASTDGQVTELQRFLSGYYSIDPSEIVTGYFGSITHGFVVQFQKEQGLPTYGIAGALTRAAIAKVCGGGNTSSTTNNIGNTTSNTLKPSCTITYVPSTLVDGQTPFTTTWSSTGATSMSFIVKNTATGQTWGPGIVAPSGSQYRAHNDLGVGSYVSIYTVTGPGGTGVCEATSTVVPKENTGPSPVPTCSVSYSPSTLYYGETPYTTIWSSTGATSLSYVITNSAGQKWGPYSVAVSGTLSKTQSDLGPGTYTATYTATGPGGIGQCQATSTVLPAKNPGPSPVPTCSVSYSPSTLYYRETPFTTTWSSTGATSMSYTFKNESGQTWGPYAVAISGSTYSPYSDVGPGTYVSTYSATGPGGTGQCQATSTILPSQGPGASSGDVSANLASALTALLSVLEAIRTNLGQ